MEKYDIIVVRASTTGAWFARQMAKRGHSVLVIEKNEKENVIKVLPEYAPQVIIFSKDPLNDYIEDNNIGKVWTIQSNSEKNEAQIMEGYLWK